MNQGSTSPKTGSRQALKNEGSGGPLNNGGSCG